jgi:hypothetical protein
VSEGVLSIIMAPIQQNQIEETLPKESLKLYP